MAAAIFIVCLCFLGAIATILVVLFSDNHVLAHKALRPRGVWILLIVAIFFIGIAGFGCFVLGFIDGRGFAVPMAGLEHNQIYEVVGCVATPNQHLVVLRKVDIDHVIDGDKPQLIVARSNYERVYVFEDKPPANVIKVVKKGGKVTVEAYELPQ